MRWLALLLWLIAGPAMARPAVENGPLERCTSTICHPAHLDALAPIEPGLVLERTVYVAPAEVVAERPVIVEIAAMASAEIRWNGVLIARNGRVGATAAAEVPGYYRFSVPVPARLVQPGDNRLSATLSAAHLDWDIRYPLHEFRAVSYGEAPQNPYWPALLVMGAIGLAGLYFAVVGAVRRKREPLLLAFVALLSLLQLGLEVARIFVPYRYDWHMPRLAAIAALAATTSLVAAAYAATRFMPKHRLPLVAATALVATALLLLPPAYDVKTAAALSADALAVAAAGLFGWRRGVTGARRTVALGCAVAILAIARNGLFLDNLYYLALAALLAALVVSDLAGQRRAQAAERDRSDRLSGELQALRDADRDSPIAIRDGARTHLLPRAQIAHIRAADDYSEVVTTDGRVLLATQTLAKLHATLPPQFRRVHKSHVVNAEQVSALGRRPGGGWQLAMKDGAAIPVGRAYAEAVADWR